MNKKTRTYSRILVKLSGEAMSDSTSTSYTQSDVLLNVCQDVSGLVNAGVSVSIVVGGGNIIRGRNFSNWKENQKTADYAGMLASVINGLFLKDSLSKIGVESNIFSTLHLPFGIKIPNADNIEKDIRLRRVAIFVGGIGVPGFSTDTSSVVFAIMSSSDIILKATKTDGIYTNDPKTSSDAKYIKNITHQKAIDMNLKIVDQAALVLARDNHIPILVFSMYENNCISRALNGNINMSNIVSI